MGVGGGGGGGSEQLLSLNPATVMVVLLLGLWLLLGCDNSNIFSRRGLTRAYICVRSTCWFRLRRHFMIWTMVANLITV